MQLRRVRSQSVAVVIGAAMLAVSACGAIGPRAHNNSGGTAAASKQIDAFLSAPKGAPLVRPDNNTPAMDPIFKQPIVLPWANAYPVPDGPIGDPSKTYMICFSQALIRHPFAAGQRSAIMIEAARHPNLKVQYYNTDNDPLQQIQQLETCANQHPAAILVWPHSTAPLTPIVKKLHDAGNIVVGMERTVATRDYTSWVYLDDKAEAYGLADKVAKDLGGKGTVAETSGAIGSSPQIVRHFYFTQRLKQVAPNIKIITTSPTDYSEADGFKVASQFLGSPKAKDIDAWFVHSTTIGLGIVKALNQAHRNIPIYGIDNDKRDVKAVLDGDVVAVAPHTPLHGDLALRLAILAIEHKKIPHEVQLAPAPLVTKDNAAEALKTTWGTLGELPR
jgi:ABC-type sugar transport system substrate-binding protein